MRTMAFVVWVTAFCFTCLSIPATTAELAKSYRIPLKDLKAAIAKNEVTLIDCNGSESFSRRHIPDAIDLEASIEGLAKLLPADKNALIVSYCSNENSPRYQAGVEAAARLGYRKIRHFAPGIRGWANAGEAMASVSSNK